MSDIYIVVLVSIILAAASFIYLKLANKFNIIDKPNHRSSHTQITIRGGGIIFPVAILLFFFFNDFQYTYFVLGVFIISIVSFLDDIYTLSSKIRFPFQILAIALILLQGDLLNMPLYLSLIYLILGVGFVNMFNFMDGINGITGIYSLSVLLGIYYVNDFEQIVNQELIIYAAISLIVFGFYNFRRKALFFAGDIGSIAVGMLIFFILYLFFIKFSSPLVLLFVIIYGADASCTLLYRFIYTKESVLDPHRHHIYQKLVDVYKISHLKVSLFYGVLQLLMIFIFVKTYKLEKNIQFIVFLGIVVFLTLLYIYIYNRVKNKKTL